MTVDAIFPMFPPVLKATEVKVPPSRVLQFQVSSVFAFGSPLGIVLANRQRQSGSTNGTYAHKTLHMYVHMQVWQATATLYIYVSSHYLCGRPMHTQCTHIAMSMLSEVVGLPHLYVWLGRHTTAVAPLGCIGLQTQSALYFSLHFLGHCVYHSEWAGLLLLVLVPGQEV